jgi:cellulose biosynthesis protein BcsQ
MSKILFWSPLHGQGQTSNLHATAFVMGMLHHKHVLMMQTHFSGNNLESPLVGQNVSKCADGNTLFEDTGLDMAVTFSNMNKLNRTMLENCCFTFPNTSLLLLPGTEMKSRETFERDIGKAVSRVIRDADECVDMVMIDSNSGDDKLSFRLMAMADLVVINLTQHRYIIDKFFMEYRERFADLKKVFFLFGDYDDNSSFNINNFRRKYGKYINTDNSGVIPYCTRFMDAQNESDVVEFMRDGLYAAESGAMDELSNRMKRAFLPGKYPPEETDYFFRHSRLSTEKMMDILQMPFRNKSRGA